MTEPTSSSGTIVVSGTGRVAVEPDVADLRLGVAISRPTVEAARAAAAEAMTAILAAVEAAGVARRDVRTTLLSVQPRYDYQDGEAPRLVGYDLANVVEVTVRELAALGGVIDGALVAGATSLDGLAFRVTDPAEAEAGRGPRPSPRRGPGPRSWPPPRASRSAASADIVEGGPPPTWPQPQGWPGWPWRPMPGRRSRPARPRSR